MIHPKDYQDISEDFIRQIALDKFPYDSFQEGQDVAIIEAITGIFQEGKEHIIIDAPTGVGKTAVAYAIHEVSKYLINSNLKLGPETKWRTTISTPTKHLQEQYKKDFPMIDDLKGKRNYVCQHGAGHYNTHECVRLVGKKECSPKNDCPYLKTRRHWCGQSQFRLTNAAMAIEMCPLLCMGEENFAPLHIIDECHKMPNAVLDHTKMKFDYAEIEYYADKKLPGADDALEAIERILNMFGNYGPGNIVEVPEEFVQACGHLATLCSKIGIVLTNILDQDDKAPEDEKMSDSHYKQIFDCIQTFEELENVTEICTSGTRNFILYDMTTRQFDADGKTHWNLTLKPIFARDVTEYALFRKNDYFVHMSATICNAKKYADDMGIPEDKLKIVTVGNPIPVENRIVNYLPVGSMTARDQHTTLPHMIESIHELATIEHPGENGLVHVSSYKLAEQLRDGLRELDGDLVVMVGRDKKATLSALKGSDGNGERLIVISPSMKEGIDLKGDLCRWQVIAKVPFGFLGDELIRYKSNKDKDWYNREVILDIVQSSGRATRGIEDYSVTYILDSSFDRVMSRGKQFFPEWWLDSVRKFD